MVSQKIETQRRFRCNFSGFSSSPSGKKCESQVDLVLAMRRLRSGKREAHALKNTCHWTEPAGDASPAQNNATPSCPVQRWCGIGGRACPRYAVASRARSTARTAICDGRDSTGYLPRLADPHRSRWDRVDRDSEDPHHQCPSIRSAPRTYSLPAACARGAPTASRSPCPTSGYPAVARRPSAAPTPLSLTGSTKRTQPASVACRTRYT